MLNIIQNAFKEIDAEMLERNLAWAVEMKIKFNSFEHLENDKFGIETYKAKVEMVGSKAMYEIFAYSNAEGVAERITKHTNNIIKNRNAKIVAKLKKKGIEEIPSFEIIYSRGSGNGWFKAGEKDVHIQTILAGGYNIQRLHQRTLCHVK